ncbi:MAG: 16S rRNA (guanine(966)-N(2))-methyltransferase RsmD [bacterium]|nr:16S rRNA (guanine(966)-N(2))-methyltransferase RsmD [bacterium]
MIRIISGKFGSRSIETPHGNKTHPMSEKMRGAIFNALGDISDLDVLDAYAGSGAVGIEALSRGAKFVYFVEKDRVGANTTKKNIETLGIKDEVKLTQANISSWLETNQDRTFDVIIADPPYDKVNVNVFEKLAEILTENGTLVLSLPPGQSEEVEGLKIVKSKSYGDSKIVFLKRA